MKLFSLRGEQEQMILRISIALFWWLFWLLNVVDKFIGGSTFLWVGKDRAAQFLKYFSSIGIEHPLVAHGVLMFVTILQITALLFMTAALWHLVFGGGRKIAQAHSMFFLGIIFSLLIFTFFAAGDQVFGDRVELLEHSIYWGVLLISWFGFSRNASGKRA